MLSSTITYVCSPNEVGVDNPLPGVLSCSVVCVSWRVKIVGGSSSSKFLDDSPANARGSTGDKSGSVAKIHSEPSSYTAICSIL
jgi:hypothetical protein